MTAPANWGTAIRIIQYALQDAGINEEGQEPSSEQIVECSNRLNDLIVYHMTRGIKLWTWLDKAVTLVSGQATYSIFPTGDVVMTKPARVISAYFLDTSSNKTPLNPMSWDEYSRLSNTTQTGALNSYFVDKQQTKINVSFWLVPDATAATGTAHLILQQQITTFTGITDSLNFPPEWFIALRWMLADDKATGQSQAIMARCKERAALFTAALEDWDVEDTSTRFTPDAQIGSPSRF